MNKNSNKINKNHKKYMNGFRGPLTHCEHVWTPKVRPISSKFQVCSLCTSCILQKKSQFAMVITLSILSLEGDIGLYGNIKMSYTISLLIIFAFGDFILM